MKAIVGALALLVFAAGAAEAQVPASAETQAALGAKLMEEINSSIALRTQLIQAQAQVKALSEENIRLKAAAAKSADPPPK